MKPSLIPRQASTTTTPSPLPSHTPRTSAGAIAGGVVGGVAALCFLVGSLLFLAKRKRNKYQLANRDATQADLGEADSDKQRGRGMHDESQPQELNEQAEPGVQEIDQGAIPMRELPA